MNIKENFNKLLGWIAILLIVGAIFGGPLLVCHFFLEGRMPPKDLEMLTKIIFSTILYDG